MSESGLCERLASHNEATRQRRVLIHSLSVRAWAWNEADSLLLDRLDLMSFPDGYRTE